MWQEVCVKLLTFLLLHFQKHSRIFLHWLLIHSIIEYYLNSDTEQLKTSNTFRMYAMAVIAILIDYSLSVYHGYKTDASDRTNQLLGIPYNRYHESNRCSYLHPRGGSCAWIRWSWRMHCWSMSPRKRMFMRISHISHFNVRNTTGNLLKGSVFNSLTSFVLVCHTYEWWFCNRLCV